MKFITTKNQSDSNITIHFSNTISVQKITLRFKQSYDEARSLIGIPFQETIVAVINKTISKRKVKIKKGPCHQDRWFQRRRKRSRLTQPLAPKESSFSVSALAVLLTAPQGDNKEGGALFFLFLLFSLPLKCFGFV